MVKVAKKTKPKPKAKKKAVKERVKRSYACSKCRKSGHRAPGCTKKK